MSESCLQMASCKMKRSAERNSRIELVRIICILTIILRHYGSQAYWIVDTGHVDNWTWQVMFTQLIQFAGSASNGVFLLISGYHMIDKFVNWKRVVLLIAEMFFYSWTILGILSLCGGRVTFRDVKEALFPIWYGYNWYVCCYVILCCFLPFINPMLNRIDQSTYRGFVIVAILLVSAARTLGAVNYLGDHFSVDFFVTMYAVGGYVKRFGGTQRKRSWGRLVLVSASLMLLSIFGMSFGGYLIHKSTPIANATRLTSAYSVLSVIMAYALFQWTITEKPFYNKFVNQIARSVIGIFIIHHNNLLKGLIWDDFSPNYSYLQSNLLPLHCIVKVAVVFISCLMIDQIRIVTVEKWFASYLNKKWDLLQKAGLTVKEKCKAIYRVFMDRLTEQ